MSALHKRPIRNGRLGEIKGQDGFWSYNFRLGIKAGRDGGGTVMPMPPWASREYRGSSAAPTLQGEAFHSEIISSMNHWITADRGGRPASLSAFRKRVATRHARPGQNSSSHGTSSSLPVVLRLSM